MGTSEESEPLTIIAGIVPEEPRDLALVLSTDGEITLSWDAPEDNGGTILEGYYLYYQLRSSLLVDSSTWLKSDLVPSGTTTHTLVGLDVALMYRIRAVAVNSKGESDFTPSLTLCAGAVPSGLSTPTIVSGSRTHDSLRINW